ncbi:MAG: energy transducer TonB [Candidatus Schekmanbacteria bacterium]|nr:energy transducer TonB [Candidatus Schekmanbacteria bacterium]
MSDRETLGAPRGRRQDRSMEVTDVLPDRAVPADRRNPFERPAPAPAPAPEASLAAHYLRRDDAEWELDRKLMDIAALIAVIVHGVLIYMALPEFGQRQFVAAQKQVVRMVRIPPKPTTPPKPREQQVVKKKPAIKPVPDPTPEEPEEFQEPDPEPELDIPIPDDVEIVFGEPEGPPAPAGPVRLTAEMEKPQIIKRVQPDYPAMARKAGIEGVVILECVINVNGRVEKVKVLRSMGKTGMDESATSAVKQWEFTPAKSSTGVPIPVIMNLTVSFTLR